MSSNNSAGAEEIVLQWQHDTEPMWRPSQALHSVTQKYLAILENRIFIEFLKIPLMTFISVLLEYFLSSLRKTQKTLPFVIWRTLMAWLPHIILIVSKSNSELFCKLQTFFSFRNTQLQNRWDSHKFRPWRHFQVLLPRCVLQLWIELFLLFTTSWMRTHLPSLLKIGFYCQWSSSLDNL